MICKERNLSEYLAHDKLSKARANALAQMEMCLKNAFVDVPDVWIFSDLRFRSDENGVEQVDHLVMHRSGFIVIESKSIISKVRIQQDGKWERYWNNNWRGMRSPIKRGERQMNFLRKALQVYRNQLGDKAIFGQMQMGFRNVPFELLVSISDSGSFDRKSDSYGVFEVGLVADCVRNIVTRHKNARDLLGLNSLIFNSTDGLFYFKDAEIDAMRRWFIERHYPRALERERKSRMQPTATKVSVAHGSVFHDP